MDKLCSKCQQNKSLEEFDSCRAKRDGKQTWCRKCILLHVQSRLVELKHETYKAYGGEWCKNCGETTFEYLTLDHITGCGIKKRKETQAGTISFLRKLRSQGWPSGFQVLCYNCNFLKFAHPTLLEVYARRKNNG